METVSLPSFQAITDSFSLERLPQLFKAELGAQRRAAAGLRSSYEAQGGAQRRAAAGFRSSYEAQEGGQRRAAAGLRSSYEAQGGVTDFLTSRSGTSPPTPIRRRETQTGMMSMPMSRRIGSSAGCTVD